MIKARFQGCIISDMLAARLRCGATLAGRTPRKSYTGSAEASIVQKTGCRIPADADRPRRASASSRGRSSLCVGANITPCHRPRTFYSPLISISQHGDVRSLQGMDPPGGWISNHPVSRHFIATMLCVSTPEASNTRSCKDRRAVKPTQFRRPMHGR